MALVPFLKSAASQPTCLVCEQPTKKVYLVKDGGTYYVCKHCRGVFVWPVRQQEYYLGTDTYLKDMSLYTGRINPYGQRWIIEQFERLYSQLTGSSEKGAFFEIGAGTGFLNLFALARGWEASGIETSAPAVKVARDHMRTVVDHSTLETYMTDKKFDAIVMVEVLEHFIDPVAAIEHLRRFAKQRTVVFGTTPNTDSLHWQQSDQDIYQPEDHIFLFNKESLQRLAQRTGLKDLTIEYFGGGDEHDSNLMYAAMIDAA
jgi:SAM-dependent methyltransferase